MVDCAAHLEATLDYPEEDIEFINQDSLIARIGEISLIINEIYQNYDRFILSKNGLQVAILGAPNSGKSSLLNALLKQERAIVTEIAGTTRDHIEESIQINGYKFKIIDTAGLRSTSDKKKKLVSKDHWNLKKSSTLIIYLYDGTEDVTLRESEGNCIHILNKMDLQLSDTNSKLISRSNVIQVSALTLDGLDKLESWLVTITSKYLCNKNDLPMLTSERQRDSMQQLNH